MKCVPWCLHSMLKVSTNWLKKSSKENTQMYHPILVKIYQICWIVCCKKILRKDQTLTRFWNIQLFMTGSNSYLTNKISVTSSPTLFYTTKTFSTSSKLPNRRRNKMRKRRDLLKLKQSSRLKCKHKWLEWILTVINQSMVKTLQSLIKCIWIIFNNSIVIQFQM